MEMQINCMQTFKWAQRICHLHIDKHIRKYKSCLVDFFGDQIAGDLLRATTRAETKKSRYFLRMFYTHLRLLCSSMLGKKCLQIEVKIYLFQLNLCSVFFGHFPIWSIPRKLLIWEMLLTFTFVAPLLYYQVNVYSVFDCVIFFKLYTASCRTAHVLVFAFKFLFALKI